MLTTTTNLTLSDVGNPSRPSLGTNVPVSLYRIIRLISMGEALGEASGTVMYNIGKNIGKSLQLQKIEDLINIVRELKIGLARVVSRESNKIIIEIDECVTCSGIPNIGRPVCHLEAGLVAGSLSKILNKLVRVKETKCWGLGDKVCEMTCTWF